MKPNNSPLAPLAIGFFIGTLTVGTAVLLWNHEREPRRYSAPPALEKTTTPTAPPVVGSPAFSSLNPAGSSVLNPAVARVAARFACSCGSCGNERLDVCSCETAQAQRAFIREQLRNGRSETEAAEALKQKYPGLKS